MPPSSLSQPRPWGCLWRMRTYARPYAGQMVGMVVLALLGVGAGITIPLVIRRVVDGPVTHGDRSGLLPLAALALALGVVESLLAFLRRFIQGTSVLGMERDVRDALYRHLQQLPPSFHDRWLSGQLLSRLIADLSSVRRFFGFGLVFLVANLATFAAICSLLVHIDPLLGAVVTASFVPIAVLCFRFHHAFSGVSRQVQDQTGDLTSRVEEAAQGVRVVKAFGRRRHVVTGYAADAATLRETQLVKVGIRARFASVLDVVPNAALGVVLVLGALAVAQDRITLGDLVAFITLALQLVWPIESLGFILASAQEAGTAAQRVFEVLDTRPDIASPAVPVPLTGPDGAAPAGRVRFERVAFRHPGAAADVLTGVDLDLAPGETLALVGTSGSGKTTLAMLVPRLADVTAGRVTIDGHDVRDVALPELRTVVATAFEEPILFSASVRENVTLGRPEATDDDVHAALDLAQAHFAYDLPWGLDTRVGEQGMSLSGGQRQRLALARAVLGRPRVLVLDDPLSALDVETEALVEEALRRVLATTTAIVVVHRPSTVALADRVAFLDGGRVVAVGTHADLLATDPAYAEVMGDPSVVHAPHRDGVPGPRREEARR